MSRPCTICLHLDRDEIDTDIVRGQPFRRIAAQHSLSSERRRSGRRSPRPSRAKAVLYAGNDPVSKASAELIQANLKRIGIAVDIKLYAFNVQITKAGTRGEPFDMNLIGWFADYPDPYDFINILLYGKTIAKSNNVNTAYFNDPVFNRRMERAALTTGDARAATYAALDRDLTKAAPFVVYGNSTIREFVSERIGCPVSSGPTVGLNLTMLCLKK